MSELCTRVSTVYAYRRLQMARGLESDVCTWTHAALDLLTAVHPLCHRIEKMKQDAILINCSRGGLVDTAALVDALESGKISGAAMVDCQYLGMLHEA